VVSSFKEAK